MRMVAVLVLLFLLAEPGAAVPSQVDAADHETEAIFAAAYNLNYDAALRDATRLVAAHPDRSSAHRTLATVIWMTALFERGGLTMDHYLGNISQSNIDLPPPPEEQTTRFRTHVDRAITIAEAQVRRSPGDIDARYDLGMALGLQASWLATVEGRVTAAFGSARRAFDAHEQVLDRAPARREAGLTVGTYRYAVAALSLPKRWVAYLAGFGGGRERGIALIEGASTAPLTATDARLALALVYSREGRHAAAYELLLTLMQEYPENRLLHLEAASAAWRAGMGTRAIELLTNGLARHDRDPRPKMPGERALWIYKRGLAYVSQNQLILAVRDLDLALSESPVGWVRGRIHLELGKVADLQGRRHAALAEYGQARTLCSAHRDPWCLDQSNRYRRRPFAFSGVD